MKIEFQTVVIILAYIVVIVLSLLNRRWRRHKEPVKESVHLQKPNQLPPKIIYAFWDSDEFPPIVKASIETWKRHCPEYEIRIMNYENTKHMNIRHRDSHARYSDFVRLWCLAETGGVWIDASVFLQRPIDDWLTPGYDYTGYYGEYNTTAKEFPVVETWFMAAPKGSKFINDWKNEFFRANDFDSMGDYVDDLLTRGIDSQNFDFNVNYLAVYLAAQYCQQKLGPYDLNLMSSDKDGVKYIIDSKHPLMWLWGEPSVNELCENLKQYKETTNMIKITNVQRPHLEKNTSCVTKLSSV